MQVNLNTAYVAEEWFMFLTEKAMADIKLLKKYGNWVRRVKVDFRLNVQLSFFFSYPETIPLSPDLRN